MIWLLDTNVLIHAARGRPALVRERLEAVSPDDVAVPSIAIAELWFGVHKSPNPAVKRMAWDRFLAPFNILPFDRPAAESHARIRFALIHRPVGDRDLFIAAIALANGLTVVTNNSDEFTRVPGLRVEDWTVAPGAPP